MRLLWNKWSRLGAALSASLALFGLAGCAATPQDILSPFSPAAQLTADLFHLVFWISVVIFIFVEGMLIFFVFRYQRRRADEYPEQNHGNTKLEITWTAIPALLLLGVFGLTIHVMGQVGPQFPPGQGIPIRVVGHQWWWEVQYNDGKVKYATDIHIPAGQVVHVELKSDNVIHSFWIPSLMGKTDVVPGYTNTTWLYTDKVGSYSGQCAEFCGAQHANMLFRVIVQSPADFEAWLNNVQAPAAEPAPNSEAARGKEIFLNPKTTCIGCHAIQGTTAVGVTGPDLTHVASRTCIAGCLLEFDHANLVKWLSNPQAVKPGTIMKIPQLTPDDVNALVAYLETLK
ncbi:MAG: cytochrome c oxidase subunit II [Chloroflexota bacterium]|nr:MAG: cytochrome c oxidase subunit II [Chloroflexota bacterium]